MGTTCPDEQHRHRVARSKVLVSVIDALVQLMRLSKPILEIAADQVLHNSPEEFEGTTLIANPVRSLLRPHGFEIGVVGEAKRHGEELGPTPIARSSANHDHLLPGITYNEGVASRCSQPGFYGPAS